MRIWYNNILDNTRYAVDVRGNRVRIGRNADSDIVLNSPFIAGEALSLFRSGSHWELVALGMNGCQVDDEEVHGGETHAVGHGQTIKLFPYTLTLEIQGPLNEGLDATTRVLDQEMSDLIKIIHLDLLRQMDLESGTDPSRTQSDEYLLVLEQNLEEIARLNGLKDKKKIRLVQHIAGHAVRAEILNKLVAHSGQATHVLQKDEHWSRLVSQVPDREKELRNTADYFAGKLDLQAIKELTRQIAQVERDFWTHWNAQVQDISIDFLQYLAARYLKKEIKDIVFGYGPLEDLLRSPTVSEIMVVSRDHIYIEKAGVLENSGRQFISDEVTENIIQRIVSRVGRRIDKSAPLVDARLVDGSRVNAIIPPIAVSGPCLTIRKFPARKMVIDDLVAKGSLTQTTAEFLRAAVLARCNILISGGTGTGKTTLLNCLSDFIPDKERIVTIEDTAELQLNKEHVVRLETKIANIEGAGAYSIRDLVKNSLRMRPDRIVVGECRAAEALDMLQAMNTGHDGSMTTIHANTSEDVILRLEVLVQMAANLPIHSIHRQIASALDLIVQLRRMRDGRRCVVQITEVTGIDPEDGGVMMRDLFFMEGEGPDAVLAPTGSLPTFMGKLLEQKLINLEKMYR